MIPIRPVAVLKCRISYSKTQYMIATVNRLRLAVWEVPEKFMGNRVLKNEHFIE